MKTDRIMILGNKESFFIRVLVKKIAEEDIDSFFCPAEVDAIDKNFENVSLLTYYMENGEILSDKLIRYLSDKLTDQNKQIIFIGEPVDTKRVLSQINTNVVFQTFPRPLDNSAYISSINDFFLKSKSGELKKNILIVDDDPGYMGLVREWLRDTYKVSMAPSGLQAIKWLGKNRVDLILLDFEMPVTSGAKVLEMLRSDPETKSIPVMFLTGKSSKENVMEVLSLKPEGYLLKTITKGDLMVKLKEFFALRN